MKSIIFDVIRIIIGIIELALAGDSDAQQKLKDILPAESYTQVVKEAQDIADLNKFGPRK